MTFLQIASLLIVLAGLFGAINYLFLKLPSAIGILVVSLLASIAVMGVDLLAPGLGMADQVRATVTGIDFSDALLEGCWALVVCRCAACENLGSAPAMAGGDLDGHDRGCVIDHHYRRGL